MRSRALSQFLAWRWAPFAGLVAGSLAFIALALLLIPDHLGSEPSPLAVHPARPPEPAAPREPTPASPQPVAFRAAQPKPFARPAAPAAPTPAAPTPAAAPAPNEAPAPEAREPIDAVARLSPSERHALRRQQRLDRPQTPISDLQPPPPPNEPPPPPPPVEAPPPEPVPDAPAQN